MRRDRRNKPRSRASAIHEPYVSPTLEQQTLPDPRHPRFLRSSSYLVAPGCFLLGRIRKTVHPRGTYLRLPGSPPVSRSYILWQSSVRQKSVFACRLRLAASLSIPSLLLLAGEGGVVGSQSGSLEVLFIEDIEKASKFVPCRSTQRCTETDFGWRRQYIGPAGNRIHGDRRTRGPRPSRNRSRRPLQRLRKIRRSEDRRD